MSHYEHEHDKDCEQENSRRSVRAKFVCAEVRTHYANKDARNYTFNAVADDKTDENIRYHKYTPGGKLEITVDNPNVNFELGKSYYLDFTQAPQ